MEQYQELHIDCRTVLAGVFYKNIFSFKNDKLKLKKINL